jgi:translation elongation factor P/translation initiation factor 5A
MVVNVTELKRGDILEIDGDPWQATEVVSQTPSARARPSPRRGAVARP